MNDHVVLFIVRMIRLANATGTAIGFITSRLLTKIHIV